LVQDIDDGLVDQIVVYKIDRLTRSLADFARLVDRLDAAKASFVSVTQSFNTATSMGRLTLNVLLSFAQFEREVTAKRIRDKIAASKKKGLWMGGQVPLGYDADGRTLKINAAEAATVTTLYDLYLRHRTVRRVKEEADRLGLRSKLRITASGDHRGGQSLDRGHIHHMLTNPVYAGRIRHRSRAYEGLHDAIIAPEIWDDVQMRLQQKAPHLRGAGKAVSDPSFLIGKLFDETGDRLTPSHTSKGGKRHRYYISHRLVKQAGGKDLTGWRLPARPLEEQIAQVMAERLFALGTPANVKDLTSGDIIAIKTEAELVCLKRETLFGLIDWIEISAGNITFQLDANALAALMQLPGDRIEPGALRFSRPFQMRKRGVETRLIVGNNAPDPDDVLIRNLARAHRWFGMIKLGQSYDEIATIEGTLKRRIQQVIEWVLLAPDIVRMILEGRQPIGLTSNWLLRHTLPSDWQEQRQLIVTL
jgi:site-specific DNA recombinase